MRWRVLLHASATDALVLLEIPDLSRIGVQVVANLDLQSQTLALVVEHKKEAKCDSTSRACVGEVWRQ
jgi:hypothetical protein